MLLDPNRNIHSELRHLRERLTALTCRDSPSLLVQVASVITDAFDHLGLFLPIVVGGLAVETYTSGDYATLDIDFVHPDLSASVRVMGALGFAHQSGNRYFIHPALDVWVEFPDDFLDRDRNRVQEVILNDGSRFLVIGIEDIIIDRTCACQLYGRGDLDSPDGIQAITLLAAHSEGIDWNYLTNASKEKGCARILAELRERADAEMRK